VEQAAARVRDAVRAARTGLVEREALCELIALAAVAGEHLLVIGPPGTAKSEAVRRMARALGGSTFEYLLGRFTEPSELFGPIDLVKLQAGEVVTRTEGMLPEAELAFLDEVFLGSTAILNTLLGLLAERRFRRGHTDRRVPLRVCVGASNAVPDDEALAAFADRFVLRAWVEPVPDSRIEDLLEAGAALAPVDRAHASVDDLDTLAAAARRGDPSAIRDELAHAVRRLRSAGVLLSDRRVVKLQKLACAAAVLSGRADPTVADLWPVVYAVPDAEGQQLARDALRELLAQTSSSALPAAAAEASRGPAARAARLAARIEAVLADPPAEGEARRLRYEGLLREVDAGFEPEERGPALEALRQSLQASL